MEDLLNCSAVVSSAAATTNCTILDEHLSSLDASCSYEQNATIEEQYYNVSNCSLFSMPENHLFLDRGFTLLLISIVSVIGNTLSIGIIGRFKIHKVPDVLVIGLALTDLIATLIPVPMSIYAYFAGVPLPEGSVACKLFGTFAQYTRYASAITVTLVSVERYFAVNRPFIYRKHASPSRFIVIMLLCWLAALILAIAPAVVPGTTITEHTGYCIFDFVSSYAISILIYAGVQYVIVFVCFVLVTKTLIQVYRRRKKMKVQGNINNRSRAHNRDHEVTFTKANLTSRISDLGKSLKKAAPIMAEKFQLGVEAQFARMLFAVVALFYISWTTIVVLIAIAQINQSQEGIETALFWGIRLTVISTALNPILYGVLARQYRLAYVYVVRLVLSKCCRCVEPPLKDVFAAARTAAGEVRENSTTRRRRDDSRYGTQGKNSDAGSVWSRSTGIPVLTRTTTRTKISIPGELDAINEEDFMLSPIDLSIIAEHSTHVPSAGELASSVIIPHQARDTHSSQTDLTFKPSKNKSSSLHDLVDGVNYMMELGPHKDSRDGVNNPLAVMTGIHGEEILERGSDSSSSVGPTPGFKPRNVYSNPAFQLDHTPKDTSKQSGNHLIDMRQAMIAASSTDDITLLSNKKTTQENFLPGQPQLPQTNESLPSSHHHPLRVAHSSPHNIDLSSAQKSPTIYSDYESGGFNPELDVQVAVVSQGGEQDGPTNIEAPLGGEVKLKHPKKWKDVGIKQQQQQQQQNVTRSQDFLESQITRIDYLDNEETDTAAQVPPQDPPQVDKRNDVNIPVSTTPTATSTNVQSLKDRFESPSPPHTSPNGSALTPTHKHSSQSQVVRPVGRRSSNGNSDSGRESMTDVVVIDIEAT